MATRPPPPPNSALFLLWGIAYSARGFVADQFVCAHRDFKYDYSTLLENLADPGHVPFTHHATVSKRSTSSVIALEVTRRGNDGFDGRWEAGPRQGHLG